MGITAAVLAGFALAPLAPALQRILGRHAGWFLALLPLGLCWYFAQQLENLPAGGWSDGYAWAPSLGLRLEFRVDGLGLLMALLISGIGGLIFIYTGAYLAGHPAIGRMYVLLSIFMASMLGVVLSDNLLALFVFWELTSISSYLLIGFDHEREAARRAALQALLITGGGGLALLAGILLIGQASGTYSIVALVERPELVRDHALYLPILGLVLLGAGTKSAQFPFHFWLPSAMQAPTPVSAYLHSATMVKAGVYLLARLSPLLGGTDAWHWGVTGIGTVTMLAGAFLGVRETDLKRILAYSTVSALGMLVLLLGIGSQEAVHAAIVFLLAHAFYKGALFLVAGIVDHEAGTRDVDRLGGLARAMPMTALAAVLAGGSMAAVPPLFGFMAKELTLEAVLHAPYRVALASTVVVASALFVTMAVGVALRPFVGGRRKFDKHVHEAPLGMWLGPLVLAALSVGLGLWPVVVDRALIPTATTAVLHAADMELQPLKLWHGLKLPLALSGGALLAGLALFAVRKPLRSFPPGSTLAAEYGPARWYEWGLAALNAVARWQTAVLQSGYLRYYLTVIALTTSLLTGYTLLSRFHVPWPAAFPQVEFYEVGLCVLILAAALAAVCFNSRLAAIASLGVVGYGVALIFVLFAAPDLAMTQFLVETLTVILFVLVFHYVKPSRELTRWPARVRDACVAGSVGALMTGLVLAANHEDYDVPISGYYIEHSLPEGHGGNIVNVILVDFRGLDTLGEISVLAVAAVGVYALLKMRPEKGGKA